MWMWIAAFSMIILYGIMAAVMFGFGWRPNHDDPEDKEITETSPDAKEAQKEDKAVAKMMLL